MSDKTPTVEELDPVQAARIARAPLPTKGTLRIRRFLPAQMWKFMMMNLRITNIVIREKLGM